MQQRKSGYGRNESDQIRSVIRRTTGKRQKNYPLGRYGQPSDIAYAIVYLLSDASSWMTGTALKIDGGMTLA
ncbi:MAG: SDR family oxidoreductase [Odoribacter splanchnicus]